MGNQTQHWCVCLTAFGPFVCQEPKCDESRLWTLRISHLRLPHAGSDPSLWNFYDFPVVPWDTNKDFLSWATSSLQTILVRKFLLRSSQITYFGGVHIGPTGKKVFILNLVILETQTISTEALFALPLPPRHTALHLQTFSRVAG